MAMWEREIGTPGTVAGIWLQRPCVVELTTARQTISLDKLPTVEERGSHASVVRGTETELLRRERNFQSTVGSNAHAIRGSTRSTKSPAATTVRLVADVWREKNERRKQCREHRVIW